MSKNYHSVWTPRKAAIVEDFLWLVEMGEGEAMAAHRLGVSLNTIRSYQSLQRRTEDGAA